MLSIVKLKKSLTRCSGTCARVDDPSLTAGEIKDGDFILLYLDSKRTYLIRAKSGEIFHTHKGTLDIGLLIGKEFGSQLKSSLNAEFIALKPTLGDFVQKISRKTQILYPKDMALIALYTGIGPGSKVVEAGTGSGALTSLLAHYVKPNGRVYSYEIQINFQELAKKNLEKIGLSEMVELKTGDVVQGIDETDVDAVVLDMATPWLVVEKARKALKGSGVLCSFSPTIEQVVKTVEEMRLRSFVAVESLECLIRRFQVKEGQTRPETLMIGHTGYISFGRKAEQ